MSPEDVRRKFVVQGIDANLAHAVGVALSAGLTVSDIRHRLNVQIELRAEADRG